MDGLAKMMGVSKQLAGKQRQLRRWILEESAANDVCQEIQEDSLAAINDEQRAACLRDAIQQLGLVFLLARSADDAQTLEPTDTHDPQSELAEREALVQLRNAVKQLPENEAQLIWMHYFEGRTLTECAAAVGKHNASVSRLHARILHRLRDAFEPSPVPDDVCAAFGMQHEQRRAC